MATAAIRRFIISVDDPGGLIRDLSLFQRTREFFDEQGVPASFMVVPRGEDGWLLDEDRQWLAALHSAESAGHDCQLHGLQHWHCEFGPYPAMIRAIHGPDPDEELRNDTRKYGHWWHHEAYVEKLTTAIGIYERAFDRRPAVFRTGALSQTPELYNAMAEVGVRYASNSVIDPRGWEYIVGNYENPGDWDADVPPLPHHLNDDVINLPIMSEYAWELTEDVIPRHLALAVEDMDRIFALGGPFVLVCHVQCVGAQDGLSRKLLAALLDIARGEYGVTFETIAQLAGDVESGQAPVIDCPEGGQ